MNSNDKNSQVDYDLNVTTSAKSIMYIVCFWILLILSVKYHTAFHAGIALRSVFLSSTFYMLITSFCLLGVGVFALHNVKTQKLKQHKADGVFLVLVGMVYLFVFLILFLGFGGISSGHEKINVAVNFCIIFISLLPLPFGVFSLARIIKSQNSQKTSKIVIGTATILSLCIYAILLISGKLMRFI